MTVKIVKDSGRCVVPIANLIGQSFELVSVCNDGRIVINHKIHDGWNEYNMCLYPEEFEYVTQVKPQ